MPTYPSAVQSTAHVPFDLDKAIIDFTAKENTASWTIRDAVEGLQIFGGIGSGKTSGSGRMIALKFLSNGFGGLVLTVKPDEKQAWQDYCRETGRLDDLVIISPTGKNYFNFLEYESNTSDTAGISISQNLLQVLKTVIRASSEKSSGKGDDPFWEVALDMLISNSIDLCLLAYGEVSVEKLYKIVQAAPKGDAVVSQKEGDDEDPFAKAYLKARYNLKSRRSQMEFGGLDERYKSLNEGTSDPTLEADERTFDFVDDFFSKFYLNLSEKTRSVVDFSFLGFLHGLLKDPIFSLLCNQPSNIYPHDCLNGKIILLDLPVKLYHKTGRDSQILFKYIWQRAMEKRNIAENGRPVFLWADEAQHFLHEYDAEYQATARSSRIATVYISQNLPNYYANMGGDKSDYRVKSFLGTLGTKIFHANADIETNRYASELIGDGLFKDTSETSNASSDFSLSNTLSIKIERIVRPEQFVKLKTGSQRNNDIVEAYIHTQGNSFLNGKNHIKLSINQNLHNQTLPL